METRIDLSAARAHYEEGRYEEALRAIGPAGGYTTDREALAVARDVYTKLGELHSALAVTNRLRALEPSPKLDRTARRLLGRLVETGTDWLPNLPPLERRGTSRQKRVLHVLKESVPYSETGFTMRSRMTLAAQMKAGFEPRVVTSLGFPGSKGIDDFPERQELHGVVHHHLRPPPGVDVKSLPFDVAIEMGARLTSPVVEEFEPDLIQAGTGYRGFETALLGIALADRLSVPFVYEVRGFQEQTWTGEVERAERGEYYRRRVAQENRCMQRAELVITIGEAMAREIVDRGIPTEKVAVAPNAVDVSRFTPRERRGELADGYGLKDRFVIGYISNLGAREGIDDLIRAVALLRSDHPEVKCLIVGAGPEREKLDGLVSQLGLSDHVALAGHVPNDQIEDHYALIDLFVVPRIDDRAARLVTPLKPLEAMAMRRPIIVSSLPALEELVEPEVRGRSFNPSDPRSLAEVASNLISHPEDLERFAKAGYEWVHEERTVESNAERYEKALAPLLG